MAQAAPALVEQNADAVTESLYKGGAVDSAAPPSCGATCDDLIELERTPPRDPGNGLLTKLRNQLYELRQRVGVAPRITTIGKILAKSSAVLTAYEAGWLIGSSSQVFVHTYVPPYPYEAADNGGSPFSIGSWTPVEAGQQLVGSPDIFAPADGFVAVTALTPGSHAGTIFKWTEQPHECLRWITWGVVQNYDDGFPHVPPAPSGALPDGVTIEQLASGVVDMSCWFDANADLYPESNEYQPYASHYGMFFIRFAPEPSTEYGDSDEEHEAQDRTEMGRTSVPAPSDPGFDAVKQQMLTLLDGHDFDLANDWLQYTLDRRCRPNPLKSTVDVPEILDGETLQSYEDCLETLGLEALVRTMNETDTGVPADAPAMTLPVAGEEVAPGTRVEIARNPAQPEPSEEDPHCVPTDTSTTDPGEAPPDGSAYPQYQLSPTTPNSFSSIDPRVMPHTPFTAHLFWGQRSFGWRKIRIRHGYGPTDIEQTRLALETDPNPTPTTPGWSGVYNFHLPFSVSRQGVSVQCLRTVVVNYNAVPSHGNRVQEVTNSFTGRALP